MTKRVYIIVRGEHTVDGVAQDPVVVQTEGRYYFRGGKHYLLYDTPADEAKSSSSEQKTGNLVKFNSSMLEVHRSGTTMLFEEGRMHKTQYRTPAGILELGMEAQKLSLEEAPHKIRMTMEYALHAGGSKVQDSKVTITVMPYPIV